METFNSYWTWANDKIGDSVVGVLDEMKFWTEVISEYMEWDETSAQRIADKYR